MAFQANKSFLDSQPLEGGQEQKGRTVWITKQRKTWGPLHNSNSSSKHEYMCSWTTLK